MSLPQELLDEILSYLPPDSEQGDRSLRNCSLVAKSWINPSRRQLFKTVEIREAALQSWLDGIPPVNGELLQHVRSLSYITDTRTRRNLLFGLQGDQQCTPQSEYRIHVLQDYFPSLHQLRHLSLSSMHLLPDASQQVETFSPFRHTLSRLTLNCCALTITGLVTLMNYFPEINRLDLIRPLWHKVDAESVPPLSRPRIEKLHVSALHEDSIGLLDRLSELGTVFDEIIVEEWREVHVHYLNRIVKALGENVKRLKLLGGFKGYRPEHGSTTLSRCGELRELEVPVLAGRISEVNLVSSITSPNIQKITFVDSMTWAFRGRVEWENFDDALYRLADRSAYKCGLEVNLRIMGSEAGCDLESNMKQSLTKFREKGRLRIIREDHDGSQRVTYSSDGVLV